MAKEYWEGPSGSKSKQGFTLKATVGTDGTVTAANQVASTQLKYGDVQMVVQVNRCSTDRDTEAQRVALQRVATQLTARLHKAVVLAGADAATHARAAQESGEGNDDVDEEDDESSDVLPSDLTDALEDREERSVDALLAHLNSSGTLSAHEVELHIARVFNHDMLDRLWDAASYGRNAHASTCIAERIATCVIADHEWYGTASALCDVLGELDDVERVAAVLDCLEQDMLKSMWEASADQRVYEIVLARITDQDLLTDIVLGDDEIEYRRIALRGITDLDVLDSIAVHMDQDDDLADDVAERAAALRSGTAQERDAPDMHSRIR